MLAGMKVELVPVSPPADGTGFQFEAALTTGHCGTAGHRSVASLPLPPEETDSVDRNSEI